MQSTSRQPSFPLFGYFSAKSGLLASLFCLGLANPTWGDAPFSGQQVIASGLTGVNNAAAAPLDAVDGADIFYAIEGSQNLAVVFQGAGGTWTTQALSPNSRSRGIEIADLDGDGDNDLLYGDYNGGRVYWRSNDLDTTGVFLPRQEVGASGSPQGVAAADIDGDGDLDAVFAARTGDGYFWSENVNGDGSSWTQHTIATSVNAAQVVVAADIDGDGDLDVAGGSSSGSGKLAWYENVAGDGMSWLSRDIYSSRIAAVAAGDLDLDGDIDLLVQDIVVDDILWWENTAGNGTAWTSTQISSFAATRKGLQVRDLDFDGDLDVIGDPNGDWWENNDKASSWTRRSYSGGNDITDTAVVDMDGDGDLDIVAARNSTNEVAWWENLTCSPGDGDADSDGVQDGCDVCSGFDDTLDSDGDLTPDGCDLCPGFDDRVDNDNDMVPDACAPTASLAIDNVTAAEGDSGTTEFTFTVTLSGSIAGGFTVPYSTQDGTATTAGADYLSASGTLTFAGTDLEQQTLTVQVVGDPRVETDEDFSVVLGTPSSASVSLGDDTGIGTLFNDDTADLSIDDPILVEGDSGTTDMILTVTATGAVDGGFSVDYVSGDNTATVADNDYVGDTGTLHFVGTDGEQQTITMQIVGDTKVEPNEMFRVHLRNPSHTSILIPDGTAHPTIQNDDSALVTASDVTQVETNGATTFQFSVTLTGEVADGFIVPYNTTDGTAITADGDYTAASGTLIFVGTPGETHTLDVTVNGDLVAESDETFNLVLGSPSKPNISVDGGVGTIQNDDTSSLAIGDLSQAENDSGTSTFHFTVTLSEAVEGGLALDYSTTDGTATTADGDYIATSGTLNFAGNAGETQTLDVTVHGDTTVESDEVFTVNLGASPLATVTISDGSGQGTIQNDDSASIAIDDVSQIETDFGSTTFQFAVTLTGDVAGGFTVGYSTSDGTADASDYTAATGTLTFAGNDGEVQTLDVTVLGDTILEADETFDVTLGTPSLATVLLGRATGLGTIQNDDSASIAIDDVSQIETNGATTFTFAVSLTGEVDRSFSVDASTVAGTAAAGSDFDLLTTTLDFAGTDGEAHSVDVIVQGDTIVETDETFTVTLGTPSETDVAVADGSGLGTIQDDDNAAVSIDDVTQTETHGPTTFTFTVSLSGDVAGGFILPFDTTDGSATTANNDYTAASGNLIFAGTDAETQTLQITVNGDTTVETDETFTVDLGSPSVAAVHVADGSGLGTIQNDDGASVSIDDVSQIETGTTNYFQFTITLTGEVAGGFDIPFATADASATVADDDYTAASGIVNFAGTDGETHTLDILVHGDPVVETDETFTVDLGSPSVAAVSMMDGSGLGTIQNDDEGALLSATMEVLLYEPPFDQVIYFIEITNQGLGEQQNDRTSHELENRLPDELELQNAFSDTPGFGLTLDFEANTLYGNGTLAAGQTVTIVLEARVLPGPGALIANQAQVRFDVDHDGINDSSIRTDDPSTADGSDPTTFITQSVVAIPTLNEYGLLAMILALMVAGIRMSRRSAAPLPGAG